MELPKGFEDRYDTMLIIVINNLIKEVEAQGNTFVTVDELKKFVHNVETKTVVVDKKYVKRKPFGK